MTNLTNGYIDESLRRHDGFEKARCPRCWSVIEYLGIVPPCRLYCTSCGGFIEAQPIFPQASTGFPQVFHRFSAG